MKKEDLLALGLNEEQVEKVLEFTKDSVPYSRFKEVIDEKNELKSELSNRDNQLEELAKITKDNEELNSKVKELQQINENAKTEYENKLASLRLDNAIELALTQSGALNNTATKALLSLENIKFENDKIVGLDEQLASIKQTDAYLFKQTTPSGFSPKIADDNKPNSNGGFKTYEQILEETK